MRSHLVPSGWRVLPVLLLVLALAMPAVPALAQDAGAVISVDAPTNGQTASLGQDVVFTGWAAHWGGPGTGIDRVVVLDAPVGAGGKQVAQAQYGLARADVGAQYGVAWTNSDFKATWKATGSAGNHTFWVYAHSVADDGWTNKTVTIQLTPGVQGSSPSSTTGGQYGSQGSGMPYSGQYGQICLMMSPEQCMESGYAPGSPNGAVPMPPYGPICLMMNPEQCIESGTQYGLGSPWAIAPPLTVTVSSTTQNSVALSWTPSVTLGITGYRVSQSLNAAGPFIPSAVASSSMSGATVGGLPPNTTSFFQVSAIAGGVASPPSAVVSAKTRI